MADSVFITGASGGIGRACALRLADEGYEIHAAYCSDEESALSLKAETEAKGVKCEIYKMDLTEKGEAERVFAEAEKNSGGFYAVVNCAGVSLRALLTDTTDEEFDRLCDVNFKGVFSVCRACVPYMVRQKRGRIVNVSSMWGVSGASFETVYSATKAAVIGLTKALARELAPSGITVNCIAPGAIDTAMNDELTQSEKEAFASEIPVGRFGKPEEIAEAVAFLVSEKSAYITAQTLTADGGYT